MVWLIYKFLFLYNFFFHSDHLSDIFFLLQDILFYLSFYYCKITKEPTNVQTPYALCITTPYTSLVLLGFVVGVIARNDIPNYSNINQIGRIFCCYNWVDFWKHNVLIKTSPKVHCYNWVDFSNKEKHVAIFCNYPLHKWVTE